MGLFSLGWKPDFVGPAPRFLLCSCLRPFLSERKVNSCGWTTWLWIKPKCLGFVVSCGEFPAVLGFGGLVGGGLWQLEGDGSEKSTGKTW
jgi:hypothetical protein